MKLELGNIVKFVNIEKSKTHYYGKISRILEVKSSYNKEEDNSLIIELILVNRPEAGIIKISLDNIIYIYE